MTEVLGFIAAILALWVLALIAGLLYIWFTEKLFRQMLEGRARHHPNA